MSKSTTSKEQPTATSTLIPQPMTSERAAAWKEFWRRMVTKQVREKVTK